MPALVTRKRTLESSIVDATFGTIVLVWVCSSGPARIPFCPLDLKRHVLGERGPSMRNQSLKSLVVLGLFAGSVFAADTDYANAIKALSPTYYYELNESDVGGGAIDSMGNASEEGFYNGNYAPSFEEAFEGEAIVGCEGPTIVNDVTTLEEDPEFVNEFGYAPIPLPGVGEGNLAHCSYDAGHIELGPNDEFAASDITVSMFFRHQGVGGTTGERLFTNNRTDAATSFQVNVGGEGLVIGVNPNAGGETAERTLWNSNVVDNPDGAFDRALINDNYGWFHLVASTHGAPSERAENIRVWINGSDRTEDLVVTEWGWGVDTDIAKIGGRREDGADSTTHSGAQDEVAIWLDRVLTDEEVASIWQAAVGGPTCVASGGDIDGSGTVDFADFLVLSSDFGTSGESPADLDCSGNVDFADFLVLSANFGGAGASQAVPEPSANCMTLVGMLCLGTLLRQRRRK